MITIQTRRRQLRVINVDVDVAPLVTVTAEGRRWATSWAVASRRHLIRPEATGTVQTRVAVGHGRPGLQARRVRLLRP
jgi:hypothetical protein